jgi:hypothetical protein
MIYEYRLYEAAPGKMPELQARFRDETHKIFARHGMKVVAYWQPMVGSVQELHYILAWDDLAHMEASWGAMKADPEWIEIRRRTEANGTLTADIRNQLWKLTDYSPVPNAS